MDSSHHLEIISKLRQRLTRLIKLAEPNQIHSAGHTTENASRTSIDLTEKIEECVRHLFNTSISVETFIDDVQRTLNVTIKSNLSLFLAEALPLAHQYLQQHQYDPFSWETFKIITIQPSPPNAISTTTTNSTRLPSLQQARFRLPPACLQLIDLTSTEEHATLPANTQSDADTSQQKLAHRFAQRQFFLKECAEEFILQTLYSFLRYIVRRLHFFACHRIDTTLFTADRYQMINNVREQIRFLVELNKQQSGASNQFQHRNNDEQKHIRSREYRLSVIEELRQKEADETACLVLRESRLKRQKLSDAQQKPIPRRLLRASLQDLIVVMENEPVLRRSKALLYSYANR